MSLNSIYVKDILHLLRIEGELTAQELGESIHAHPNYVRKILNLLKDNGNVTVRETICGSKKAHFWRIDNDKNLPKVTSTYVPPKIKAPPVPMNMHPITTWGIRNASH